jgi:hypothetical protein
VSLGFDLGQEKSALLEQKVTPNITVNFDTKDSSNYFREFALNIGMHYLGSRMSDWLSKHLAVQNVLSFLTGISDYSSCEDYEMIGGEGATFILMCSQQKSQVILLFFNLNDGRFRAMLSFFSAIALPQVNRRLETEGYSQSERAAYLTQVVTYSAHEKL